MGKKSLLSAFLAAILIGGLVLASAMRLGTVQVASASYASLPMLLWKNQFSFPPGSKDTGRDWSAPTVVDGIVYVGATSVINGFPYYPNPPPDYVLDWWSDFYAFNASNGALIWGYRDESSFTQTPCVVKNGIVFFGARSDDITYTNEMTYILALNASNGDLLRKITVSGEISSPILANDSVFFGGGSYDEGYVVALNTSNVDLLWKYTVIGGKVSSPVVANGMVYFTGTRGNSTLYAINATNGNRIWAAPDYGRTSPKIVNGVLYISSANAQEDYELYALDASSGERIWNFTTEFWATTPIVTGGAVYFGADKNIYALNAATGAKLWNYSTIATTSLIAFQYESSSLTVANGIVYDFSNREANLLALKASNGAKLWNYTRAVGNPPIVVNGVVYLDINGCLCAFNAYNGKKIWDSSLPTDFNTVPPLYPAVTNNALYYGLGNALYALQLPSSASVTSSANIVPALTDEGQMVNLTISGNVTSSQISNVYITSDQSTSAVYLTVTGVSGTAGFSNMTIPKGLICNETIPTTYIDDQIAEKQGYTQDRDNYYVWYATNFSSSPHQISIIFSESQNLKTSSLPDYIIWLGAASAAVVVAVSIGLLLYFKKRKHFTDRVFEGRPD